MKDGIPVGKFKRTISSGKIATRLGSNQLGYYLKEKFASEDQKDRLKKQTEQQNAKILFEGLAFLRGTALKAAQLLSLESDLLPEDMRKELEKSYHKVPPINRALVKKIIQNNYGQPAELLFQSFDSKAFAAASLGQVHKAETWDNECLALKIQYPDIASTISNDMRLLKGILRPMSGYDVIKTALDEIQTVLLKETDYGQEASNVEFFRQHLNLDDVGVPKVNFPYTTNQILAMSYMDGVMLDQWLETNPDQKSRIRVAQTLHDIFVKGFYELGRLHADPNPGNYLVMDDLKIGLLDFGCVREYDKDFVRIYQELISISSQKDRSAYTDLLYRIKLISDQTPQGVRQELVSLFMEIGDWFGQMFRQAEFDFGANPGFMAKGKQIGMKMHHYRNYIQGIRPEFIFLDRTRYGLMRLFEKMQVKIKIRNAYETCPV